MSAELVSNATLSIIANSVSYYKKDYSVLNRIISKYSNGWLVDGKSRLSFEYRFFSELLSTNLYSIRTGHVSSKDEDEKIKEYKYDRGAPVVDIAVLVNLIDYWKYQSGDGIAGESDFYRLVSEIQKQLALLFVEKNKNKEYWGVSNYSEIEKADIVLNPYNRLVV